MSDVVDTEWKSITSAYIVSVLSKHTYKANILTTFCTEDPSKRNIGCDPDDYPTAKYIEK